MSVPSAGPAGSTAEERAAAPRPVRTTRPLLWSLRREVWENRSLLIAPLAVTGVVLLASLIHLAVVLPERLRELPADDPVRLHNLVVVPFTMPVAPIMLACFLVGVFYASDALYGERRDRGLLFWKSLPVSDLTTVASKALVPLVVLPSIALALSVATLFTLLVAGSTILLANGMGAATPWTEVRFVQEPVVMLYGLIVHALWFAPSYAWLLLVSAWARRLPILWALLPPFAIAAAERITLGTSIVADFLRNRFFGAVETAFTMDPRLEPLARLEVIRFLTTPALWLGLLAAAAFFAATVWLRRTRAPL